MPSPSWPRAWPQEVSQRQAGKLAGGLESAGGKPRRSRNAKWIAECAKDLLANRGESLVVAGHRQPLAVHLLAHAINAALGNFGKTVVFHDAPATPAKATIGELAKALNAGQVETLVMLGGNPAYNAPADLNWADTQAKPRRVVRLGYYEDESFAGMRSGISRWRIFSNPGAMPAPATARSFPFSR